MSIQDPYRIPPTNALAAFESAARHGSFTLAACELRSSQAAVSRQIGKLETWLSAGCGRAGALAFASAAYIAAVTALPSVGRAWRGAAAFAGGWLAWLLLAWRKRTAPR